MTWSGQKARALAGLAFTLLVLYLVPSRPVAAALLGAGWFVCFRPIATAEWLLFAIAGTFFVAQNYLCLRAGIFEFRDKDILLMPYYEPVLWGFYFLALKRFVAGAEPDAVRIDARSVAGLAATSVAFSLFGRDARLLLAATACSTALLLLLFHTPRDLVFAVSALILGAIVELFGVSNGLWRYPVPDVLGIPLWFATMWISVGVLGRRFAIPASEFVASRVAATARSGRAPERPPDQVRL